MGTLGGEKCFAETCPQVRGVEGPGGGRDSNGERGRGGKGSEEGVGGNEG